MADWDFLIVRVIGAASGVPYSIQARVGRNGWAHLHEGGKPMFFDSERERDAALKKLTDG